MKYIVKPIVCDYAVVCVDSGKTAYICNIRSNAELIADILNSDDPHTCPYEVYPTARYICNIKENAELIEDILRSDTNRPCAYSYDRYPNAKYKVIKAGSEDEE